MKRLVRLLSLGLLGLILLGTPAEAAAPSIKPPGVVAAETLSQVTGIAISPLMGVGAVGAWRYFQTPPAQRARLSWYAQPWFWIPSLVLVAMCFAKDAAGPVIPTALKKPLDIAEVFENKLSGLIATGAIIPLVLEMFRAVQPEAASLGGSGMGAIDLTPLYGALMVPVALIAYAIVFLVSHTINILILISPFATVDAALKGFRLFLLSTVAGSSLVSSTAGAIWAGVLILCCLPLAGWAFRLAVFGHVFAWDIVTFRRKRFIPTVTRNRAFLARKLDGVPRRTFGHLTREADGSLVFSYRPWLVLAPRRVTLPRARYAIGRGFLHPELLEVRGTELEDVLDLPPRYCTHEAEFGLACGVEDVRDVGLLAAWSWFRSLFGAQPAPEPPAEPATA